MRALLPRGAFGLRGRIVGLLLVTTVATLAIAAVALLGPLEKTLRTGEQQALRNGLKNAVASFDRLRLPELGDPSSAAAPFVQQQLLKDEQQLAGRIGASTVVVLAPPSKVGGRPQLLPVTQQGADPDDPYDDVTAALAKGRPLYSFGSIDGIEYVRAAIPFRAPTCTDAQLNAHPLRCTPFLYVLTVRKSIGEVRSAVVTVRNAFITAALAGLALALILGIPLAATLVRRLRRLRQAALRLAQEGPGVQVPVDHALDEVGDLARTLAIMQERLAQQEEARRAFVATASHELRTPLTSLDGMLELLEEDLSDPAPDLEDARPLLERARAQSRRLGRLAADLLDLSRLDAQVRLRSEPVELSELSRAVMAEFELGTAERGIAVRLDDDGASVWALGDPGGIARILRILLDNAVRISPECSEIRIELQRGEDVVVRVCDQGPGVPEGERELIFRRFERGRVTHGQAGFGLGLAIGRELAERMGGRLVLEDTPGPGATFALHLPPAPSRTRALSRSSS